MSHLKIKKKAKITAFILNSIGEKQPSPHNSVHTLASLHYIYRATYRAIITEETYKLKAPLHGEWAR